MVVLNPHCSLSATKLRCLWQNVWSEIYDQSNMDMEHSRFFSLWRIPLFSSSGFCFALFLFFFLSLVSLASSPKQPNTWIYKRAEETFDSVTGQVRTITEYIHMYRNYNNTNFQQQQKLTHLFQQKTKSIKSVQWQFITYNRTSTGVQNQLPALQFQVLNNHTKSFKWKWNNKYIYKKYFRVGQFWFKFPQAVLTVSRFVGKHHGSKRETERKA